jgi:uncharacterized membrane protein YeiH
VHSELTHTITGIMYFGDVVFAISGALVAARFRMDIIGFILIGTFTGIGGGTIRDLLLGRTVWWTHDPFELLLCIGAALVTFFWVTNDVTRRKAFIWADALGLASFSVVGCHIALEFGTPFVISVFMGVVTATGGGVIRDVITNQTPMIMHGQLYATAALVGSLVYALLANATLPEGTIETLALLAAFMLRAAAIKFNICMGPPGEFITIGKRKIDE